MRHLRVFTALLLGSLLAACSDGPTDPGADQLKLEILAGTVPFEEETLAPGTTLKLTTRLTKPNGEEATGGTVQWKSDNTAVADVDATGTVTARSQTGTARIIATNGSQADTGRVNVAQPLSGAVACVPGDAGRLPAVGEVLTYPGPEVANVCLLGGTTTAAEYALIEFNASSSSAAQMTVRIQAPGVVGTVGQPVPSLAPARLVGPYDALERDTAFHHRLLARSHDDALLRLEGGLRPGAPLRAAIPSVGDTLELNVESRATNACDVRDARRGRVVAITERAIVVADVANPSGGFTDADYRSIGMSFDTLVWRVDTQNFGTPSDVDKNGKVLLFYTRAVNELTSAGSDSYVGGFFYNRDLFPTTGSRACKNSNFAEMFYMLVPDPRGAVNGNVRTLDFVRNSTLGVLAHEFQHLINDSRRMYVNTSPVWEETWLNEGLSHIAEELAFYTASGLTPGQNLGPDRLTGRALEAYNQYASDNMERLIRFLREPESNSPIGSADRLPTRGAAWAFLRYAADREAGSDAALWNRLVNSRTAGLENLTQALGTNPREWMADWAVAVYTDDAWSAASGVAAEARFQQPSWNYRTVLPVMEPASAGNRYPLRTRTAAGASDISLALAGGGAAYLRFGVPAGQRVAVRATVGGLPAPSRLRVAIVRTR